MDGGELGLFSKLYYRELIARFGHHLALNWNLGEENTQPIPAVIATAEFIDHLDPYNHPMVIHTYPSKDERYAQLTGGRSILAGASLQLSDRHFRDVHDRVLKWRTQSKEAGRPWVIAVDEPGDAKWALLTDEENPSHDSARVNALWGTLMAGGYGVEWYFGYASPNSDLTCQDFRSRDLFWNQNKAALEFFNQIPFWRMDPSDDLTSDNRSWCLAEKNQTYVVYLPPQQRTTSVNLGNTGYRYTLRWYNPRKGRFWKDGKIIEVSGKGMEPLGDPPADIEEDWVVLLERQ